MDEKFYEFTSFDGRTVVMVLETTEARARIRCEYYLLEPRTIPVDDEPTALEVDMSRVVVRDVHEDASGIAERMREGMRMLLMGIAAKH
jgi:hypothetical protein